MDIVRAIISNNDVAFYRSMLCTDAGNKKEELLSRIVDMWLHNSRIFISTLMDGNVQASKQEGNTGCKNFKKRFA